MHKELCPQELRKDIGDAHRYPCTCGFEVVLGKDWYCHFCDRFVPQADSRDGHHDEAKGGCGKVMSSCKFDGSAAPRDWQ